MREFTKLPEIATPGHTSRTIAFFSAISTFGSLVHPYLITIPAGWIDGSVMTRFYLCAVILTAASVLAFFVFSKRKQAA